MAGELEKPDKVHTLWTDEIEDKLWTLPIGELYMVGKRTESKLKARGIFTIGDLAKYDEKLLKVSLNLKVLYFGILLMVDIMILEKQKLPIFKECYLTIQKHQKQKPLVILLQ